MEYLIGDLLDTLYTSSIKIVLELAGLNEEVISHVILHLLLRDKVIISAIDLMRTGMARGVRDTATETIRLTVDQLVINAILQGSQNDDRSRIVHMLHSDDLVGEDGLI